MEGPVQLIREYFSVSTVLLASLVGLHYLDGREECFQKERLTRLVGAYNEIDIPKNARVQLRNGTKIIDSNTLDHRLNL